MTTGPTPTYEPLPSADGKKVFVITARIRGELVRYDAASRQFLPYLSEISAISVNFSPDRKWVAYVAYPEGTLWRSKADGSERLQLTFPPLFVIEPWWSPDGTRIAFMAQQPGWSDKPWGVYVISAEGGSPEQPVPGDHLGEDPTWSRDGNSLLFCHGDDDRAAVHGMDLQILDLRTHTVSKVPGSEDLKSPHWSPDGLHFSALGATEDRLLVFDVKTQKWAELVNKKLTVGWEEWSRDGEYVYFLGYPQARQERGIFRVRVSDRKLELVASLKDFRQVSSVWGAWAGLAPDDSPLLLRDAGTKDIYALDLDAR